MSSYCKAINAKFGFHKSRPLSPNPWNFSLPKGSLTALIGPNGAGKTTFLQTLAGEQRLLSGKLWLFDTDLSESRLSTQQISEWIALVPQEHVFPMDLELRDLLRLAFLAKAGVLGKLPNYDDPRIKHYLKTFGLEPLSRRPLRAVSAGERQKAFLATALLQNPKLLLLDEPTNHLDPGAIKRFWEALIQEKAHHEFEVLLSTHDLEFVKTSCDWLLALKSGECVFEGTPENFWNSEWKETLYQ